MIKFPTRTARTESRTDDSQGLKINNRDILRKENDGGGAEAAGRMSSDRDGSRGIRGSPRSSVPELQWRRLAVEAEEMKRRQGAGAWPPCRPGLPMWGGAVWGGGCKRL